MSLISSLAPANAAAMRCRPCRAEDGPAIVDLLCAGFPTRERAYWERAITRLAGHATAMGASFGQALESADRLVGVLLIIPSSDTARGGGRCNVSSWYVEPAFRSFAPMLLTRAGRDRSVTFFNISPATHTRPIIEAQGFRRYGTGRFWAVPWLESPRHACITRLASREAIAARFEGAERGLLADHLAWGCVVVALDEGAAAKPFVFLPRLTKGVVPSAQLVYCRDLSDFVGFAGPLGRWLLRRGFVAVAIDADGPIPGLKGRFVRDDIPKYFKGPAAPRLGDMSYTELVMFGP